MLFGSSESPESNAGSSGLAAALHETPTPAAIATIPAPPRAQLDPSPTATPEATPAELPPAEAPPAEEALEPDDTGENPEQSDMAEPEAPDAHELDLADAHEPEVTDAYEPAPAPPGPVLPEPQPAIFVEPTPIPPAPAPVVVEEPTPVPPTPVPPTPEPPPPAAPVLGGLEGQMYAAHNQQRGAHGAGALQLDSTLTQVARQRAQDMANRGYFAHTSPTGETAFTLLAAYGYSYNIAGENIARNNHPQDQSVGVAMTGFMNSPSHRANILDGAYTRVGIGVALGANGMIYYAVGFAG